MMLLSALFSFGGGSGQIPVIQARWVEPGLLAPELFSFALAITYLAPGPRAGFIAGIGYYLAGLPGAVAALLGLVLPTCLGAGGLSFALDRMERVVRLVQPSSAYIIGALIAAAAWGTAVPLRLGVVEIASAAAVAALVAWRNPDPVWVVIVAIVVGSGWSVIA
ncbi:MAG: chromate transporter [Nitriliruptorales bacterium]|nr:chromate transporter [Nitriliruptorales bacterium]